MRVRKEKIAANKAMLIASLGFDKSVITQLHEASRRLRRREKEI
jgi:hypothetical protein